MGTRSRQRSRTSAERHDGGAIFWAAVGGIVASIVIGIPMHLMGMIVAGPAALVQSDNAGVGWVIHILAGILFAAPYGFVVHATRYGRAALLGGVYGLVVGIVFAWLALFTIVGMPLLSAMGALDVAMHVVWGIVVGLVQAWGLRLAGPAAGRGRLRAGSAP
jgi:hypothetical protein